jgi:hypothetical protein
LVNGDPTRFNERYTVLTTRLSTPAWRHIHLASPTDPSNTVLSQALYSVLFVALHDQASDHWRSREDILHDGIALLHKVIQFYRVSHSYYSSLINLLTAWDIFSRTIKKPPSNCPSATVSLFPRPQPLANHLPSHSFATAISSLLAQHFILLYNLTYYIKKTSLP